MDVKKLIEAAEKCAEVDNLTPCESCPMDKDSFCWGNEITAGAVIAVRDHVRKQVIREVREWATKEQKKIENNGDHFDEWFNGVDTGRISELDDLIYMLENLKKTHR